MRPHLCHELCVDLVPHTMERGDRGGELVQRLTLPRQLLLRLQLLLLLRLQLLLRRLQLLLLLRLQLLLLLQKLHFFLFRTQWRLLQ